MSDKKKGRKRGADALKPGPGKSEPEKAAPAKPEPEKAAPAKPAAAEPEKPAAPAPEKAEPVRPVAPAKPPEAPKKKSLFNLIENAILVFGFLVLFGSMFLGDLRTGVAQGIDVIVSPITSRMPFYIVVLVIATIVTIFSTFIQKYTMDWDLLRRVNERNRILGKEMREAQLAGNKAKIKKLQDEQMAGMQEQTQISKMQFKPMGFLAIISVPLFLWAWWYLSTANPPLTMVFPFAGEVQLATGGFFIFPWWIVWSILCSFALSQVVRKAFNIGSFS